MAAIEKAQLHHLERRDIGNELRAGVLPRGTRASEAVFDDPLAERLGRNRRRVVHAEQAIRFRQVGARRRRHDPVDHRAWEGYVGADPPGERRIAFMRECCDQTFHHPSVVRQVVATDEGERTCIRRPSRRQPRRQDSKCRLRQVGVREVMRDLRMGAIERAGRGIMAIALFGDGRGDNGDARIREARNKSLPIGPGVQSLAHASNHARHGAFAALREDGVEPILRCQRLDGPRSLQRDAADPPARIAREDVVRVHGLMRAVECTEPHVQDADGHARRIEGGPRDGCREVGQGAQREAIHFSNE